MARTYGLITQIDDAVGRIVDRLDLSSTVLFFTSDHGDYAGHRGLVRKVPWIPFDDLARVPFFVTGAGVAGGRHDRGLAQSFDFATTCLDYAGVDVDPATFDGISLVPVLGDPGASLAEDRTVHCGISMGWPMVRRGPHKYLRSGWGEEVLFDVERDPGEVYNLLSLDPGREIVGALAEASANGGRRPSRTCLASISPPTAETTMAPVLGLVIGWSGNTSARQTQRHARAEPAA